MAVINYGIKQTKKNMAKTKNIIGTKAYPRDNSYSYEIGGSVKKPRLAGHFTFDGSRPARKVTIVSNPYKLAFMNDGERCVREFVTVKYRDKLYVVLNNFKQSEF